MQLTHVEHDAVEFDRVLKELRDKKARMFLHAVTLINRLGVILDNQYRPYTAITTIRECLVQKAINQEVLRYKQHNPEFDLPEISVSLRVQPNLKNAELVFSETLRAFYQKPTL